MEADRRYQLRHAAGRYWLLDMQQEGLVYHKPIELNECAAFISAYGEVKESHGTIGEKNTFMAEYRKRYPRRSAFIQELVKFGYVK